MNPLHPPPMFFFPSNPNLFDDAEMLQSDVMRFFAILCLCLMAIFALVKTLPMAPPDARPAIMEPADLKAEAKRLQKKIVALKEKLEEMQSQILAAAAAADKVLPPRVDITVTGEKPRREITCKRGSGRYCHAGSKGRSDFGQRFEGSKNRKGH